MTPRPAVFLDRDGTVIVEESYLDDPDGVHLVPGAADAMRRLRGAGFVLVIVTNQSGIARGLYSLSDYEAVAARLEEVLQGLGVAPDATRFCPHHPDRSGPCGCRKPDTGMHRSAAEELGIDLQASYYVGDKRTDVLPARALGGQGILVRTGYGAEQEAEVGDDVWVVDDLAAAADAILAEGRGSWGDPLPGRRLR